MKMILLHQNGEPVLVNADKIETVHKDQSGSYVCFYGGDSLKVEEDQEIINSKIQEAYR